MTLLENTQKLPSYFCTAPIYAKGVKLPNKETAQGKSPLGKAATVDLSPAASAIHIERAPETFKAVGVYTGARSKGLCIFDVDANLAAIKMKWGEDLKKAPKVTSPKKNAAKYLFTVPEDQWFEVADISHAAGGHEGWEVLWGRQGLLFGAYPGHEATKTPEGEYRLKGNLDEIPEAPSWLLERMKEQYKRLHDRGDKKHLKDARYSGRSREEKIVIAQSCLSVIPPRGAFSERFWWEIGAMINSELPNEDGLKLWEDWSKRDPDYTYCWENGNPCSRRWNAGFRRSGEGLGYGTLIKLADKEDPTRARFQRDGIARVVEEIEAQAIKYRQEYLGGQELLDRVVELEETIEDPALLDQAKTILAMEAGRHREGAMAVDRLLDAHLTFKRNAGGKPKDLSELDATPFDYLIPGLLPKPWLLLIHADGGTGKSAMCQTLCKHISTGKPFNVHGGLVEVEPGKCLWLNGDQSERITRRQFDLIGVTKGVNVIAEWDMQWYRKFCKIQNDHKYDLVVIDSLDGCNDSNPYEENRREYALPLKKLARRNGQDFHACSIIVIHHNNRNGGFRGTSAIKAAVDETWNMQKISAKELAESALPINTRIVTVEKSRDDREGQKMVFSLLPDYTYAIGPVPDKENTVKDNTPNQHMLDILKVMREDRKPWCVDSLVDHEKVGGIHKKRAIRYSLSKLESQKLVVKCAAPKTVESKGRPPAYFVAVGSAVPGKFISKPIESNFKRVLNQTPSAGTVLNDKTIL